MPQALVSDDETPLPPDRPNGESSSNRNFFDVDEELSELSVRKDAVCPSLPPAQADAFGPRRDPLNPDRDLNHN